MGFTIPNYTDAVASGVGDQAEPDSVDFQILGNPANGVVIDPTGYPSNGAVTATATASHAVDIAAYKVFTNGSYRTGTAVTASPLDEGGANPRFDLVVVTTSGTIAIRKGTESSTNPVFPALTDGDVVLAAIYRPAGGGSASYATTGRIIDKRQFIASNTTWLKTSSPTSGDGANGDIWIDTSATATGQSMVWVKRSGVWENLAEYVAMSASNTADNLVLRDSSGNFSAGTITATLNGNASTATSATSAASATLASKASTLAQGGGNGTAMTFNWSGQGGQPTWLWGSNDGSNHYVYNPSNFNVSYANSAGNASTLSGYGLSEGTSGDAVVKRSTGGAVYASEYRATGGGSASFYDQGSDYTYLGLACLRVKNSDFVYSTTISGGRTVLVNSNQTLGTSASTRRVKENIVPYVDSEKKLLDVPVVTFDYKASAVEADAQDTRFNQFGMIAEDLHDAGLNHLVHYDVDHRPEAINYMLLSVELLGIVKQQEAQISELISRVDALEGK